MEKSLNERLEWNLKRLSELGVHVPSYSLAVKASYLAPIIEMNPTLVVTDFLEVNPMGALACLERDGIMAYIVEQAEALYAKYGKLSIELMVNHDVEVKYPGPQNRSLASVSTISMAGESDYRLCIDLAELAVSSDNPLEVITHEFIHLDQHMRGDLSHSAGSVVWKGTPFKCARITSDSSEDDKVSYITAPHELEAYLCTAHRFGKSMRGALASIMTALGISLERKMELLDRIDYTAYKY